MIRALLSLALSAVAAPVMAQGHAGHAMPTDPHAGHAMPPAAPTVSADPHAGHAMSAPATAPDTSAVDPVGTDQQPGSAPAPTPPTDRYGDRYWPADAMAAARDKVRREHGGMNVGMVMINIAEWQPARGKDRFRWDGEGWFGGDVNRLTVKTEGEGVFGGGVEEAEAQALYSRALDAYWNLQAGVRQDLGPGPKRTYAVIGAEGLAPYWFEVEGALFLSNKGDVSGRIEAYYDQRITQRLIVQPRTEIDVSAQDVAETRTGRGLSKASLDLRLRYEIRREFAPYVGISHERRLGRTARYAQAGGEDRADTRFVMGLRTWF